ncbi:uncharacterized protein AB675_10284 [Cyphellophora attinorum]|uniref:F-box domain-containing protein n=1 Tax=Cyphellophora attinorum TaxID=1664694 RepID=A0A0N1H722_9EURO|nr:uncharacterized protein AB675_10284 [Phialophora attinorum]KPI37333.1 hypothetical protein AB675_10284 [Phialophora attinorum]
MAANVDSPRRSSLFGLFKKSKKERSQSVAPTDDDTGRKMLGNRSPRRSLQLPGKDNYVIEHRSTNLSSLSGHSGLRTMQSPEQYKTDSQTEPGESIVARFTERTWQQVYAYLSDADLAAISFSCKAFHSRLGTEPFQKLADPDNLAQRYDFLQRLDKTLPGHLLCFDCHRYHKRIAPGEEKLVPINVQSPVYDCPEVGNPNKINPRIRITFDRIMPLTFVQMAMRAHRFGAPYGITMDTISRRYKDKVDDSTWSHQTKFAVVKGHLLMRVMSSCYAPPGLPPAGERHLLYSRQNFIPFFSVCPHWQDGVLMPNVKCALRHIPKPLEGSGLNRVARETKLHFNPEKPIVSLCHNCKPMRRCPECPSEYLIEIRMTEDKADPTKLFKQTLVVTRWSDLGDGSSPFTPEWEALNGKPGFDSVEALGKRAVAGQFEAEFNGDVIPSQNMLSMNPEKMKLGEKGHDWY